MIAAIVVLLLGVVSTLEGAWNVDGSKDHPTFYVVLMVLGLLSILICSMYIAIHSDKETEPNA